MKRILFIIIALFIINIVSFSQKPAWIANPFEHFVFIENKGQFDQQNSDKNNRVYYNANSKGVEIYFHSNGLTYAYDEVVSSLTEEEKERMERSGKEEEIEKSTKRNTKYLHVEWVGANPFAVIEGNDVQSFYYTYPCVANNGSTTFKAACFKKITYKNLYPNIDVEYILPEKGGVKYSLILHPGADPLVVRMKYINAKEITTDKQGNIIIKSEFGEFTDHAPVTFCGSDRMNVNSSFTLHRNEISFNIDNYNKLKELIIDPWTTSPVFTGGYGGAYDVNYDLAGNVYVYGSYTPFKLAKFNSVGVFQWVFNATTFGDGGTFQYYGDFALDEVTGTSYLVEGGAFGAGTGARVFKINTLGVKTGTYPGNPNVNEMWRAEYNRCINKIMIGAGGTSSTYQAEMLDTNLVNVSPVNILSTAETTHDIALLAIDNTNNSCYMATSNSAGYPLSFDNTLMKCPIPSLIPPGFSVPDLHKFGEGFSGHYPTSLSVLKANGVNGIAVSPGWLYTYNSDSLKRWNKTTGTFVSGMDVSLLAPSYTLGSINVLWSGLSVDECDNIYVGFQSSVRVYNSSLMLTNIIQFPNSVYDVKLGLNKNLYVCGEGFVSEVNVPHNTTVVVTQTPASGCTMCNGTAKVSALSCGGNPAGFVYSWSTSPAQTTQTATGLCPGNYTVTLTINCFTSFTSTVTVVGNSGTLSATVAATSATCNNNNGSATATPGGGTTPYSYSWSSGGQTTATATGIGAGTYTVTIADGNGCTSTSIAIVGNSGGPTITSITKKNPLCSAGTGMAVAIASGGTGTLTYNWSNGSNSVTASGLVAGIYTVTVNDVNNCSNLSIVSITVPAAINLSASQNTSPTCIGNNGVAIASASGGTGTLTYTWSNGQAAVTATGLITGTYMVTAIDANGCTTTSVVTITPPTNINVSSTNVICERNGTASVTVTSGVTPYVYSWSSGQTTANILVTAAGNYTVTITEGNGCTAIRTFNITGTSSANAAFTQSPTGTVCTGATVTFKSTSIAGSHSWFYSPPFVNVSGSSVNFSHTFLTAGTYLVGHTVTNGNCISQQNTTVIVVNCAVPTVAALGSSICLGSCATVTSTAAYGTAPYTYLWSNGATTQNINPCPVSATTYTVTITDNTGLTATSTASVTINPAVIVTVNATNLTCNASNDGAATAVAGGGSPAFTYNWSGGISGSGFQVSGLSAGNYTVTVTDNKGCTGTSTVTIAAPPILSGQFTKGTANCAGCGCQEWLMITASGGTSPYSYSWSASGGIVNRYRNQLCPGTYNVNIKDKNGCSINVNLTTP